MRLRSPPAPYTTAPPPRGRGGMDGDVDSDSTFGGGDTVESQVRGRMLRSRRRLRRSLLDRWRRGIYRATAWARLFGPHQSLSAEERQVMQQYETLDYNRVFVGGNAHQRFLKEDSAAHAPPSGVMKWCMFFVVGAFVGLIAFVIRQTIDLLSTKRQAYIAYLMNAQRAHSDVEVEPGVYEELPPNYGLAWAFSVSSSCALLLLASCPVVFYWPKAAGSGIEEVIAYLNGVEMPRVFNVRTACIKFFSCIASVSSGLPVGPEGPLVHLGACCGAGLTQGRSKTLRCDWGCLRQFRNNRDHRDFITAGAAAGISAAFGAPIGGLLFVMEDMATHWAPSLTWMIFFTSMTAFFVVSMFNSAFEQWQPTGTFGWLLNEAAVLFEVKEFINLNIAAVFPAVIIGTICGLLGAVFTLANTRVNLWRRRVIVPHKKMRVTELLIIATVYVSLCLFLPTIFPCEPIRKGMEPLGDRYKWQTESPEMLVTYLCPDVNHYSPLGTLTLSDNEGTIRRLFSRKTDPQFGIVPLIIFLAFYFCFACWCAGTAASTGLLIPMIVIGSTIGRLVGHVMVLGFIHASDGTYRSHHQWMDPGVFALVGAGAFITGVSRLTVSITVVMLEISGELHFLLPIMVAVMIAKWVADLFTCSLYHTLLHLKSVPLLPLEPKHHLIDLERLTARDAVGAAGATPGDSPDKLPEVVTLGCRSKVRECVDVLRTKTHHMFPVTADGGLLYGTILRRELETLLQSPEIFEPDVASTIPRPEDLPRDGPQRLSFSNLSRRHSLCFLSGEVNWFDGRLKPGHFECYIDLTPYANRSPFVVQPHFSLKLTYECFTALGLRHLIVAEGTRVVGVITRKDLLSQHLEDRFGSAALAQTSPLLSTQHSPPLSPPMAFEMRARASPLDYPPGVRAGRRHTSPVPLGVIPAGTPSDPGLLAAAAAPPWPQNGAAAGAAHAGGTPPVARELTASSHSAPLPFPAGDKEHTDGPARPIPALSADHPRAPSR